MKHYFWLVLLCTVATTLQAQSGKLLFDYDTAGNQVKREYCQGDCPVLKKAEVSEETPETIAERYDDQLVMYPNPTSGLLTVDWGQVQQESLQSIKLVNYLGVTLQQLKINRSHSTQLDLSPYPTGVYIMLFHFTDKSTFSQKIIKK